MNKKQLMLIIVVTVALSFSVFSLSEVDNISQDDLVQSFISIIIDGTDHSVGEQIPISAIVDNVEQLNDVEVELLVDGSTVDTELTDDEGIAEFLLNTSVISPGSHLISAGYFGDDKSEYHLDSELLRLEEKAPSGDIDAEPADNDNILSTTKKTVYAHGYKRDKKDVIDNPRIKTLRNCDEKEECSTDYLTIDDVKIGIKDYACTLSEEGEEIVAVCDSVLDGNGDGICQSGESCMKLVIDGKDVRKYEKNSRYDFVEADESFFSRRIDVEVSE